MKIHEFQAKKIFSYYGIPIPEGETAKTHNNAVMLAYYAGNDYFYRISDDSILQSTKWTEAFIEALAKMSPTNVGMVGPNHSGGKICTLILHITPILTYLAFTIPTILTICQG